MRLIIVQCTGQFGESCGQCIFVNFVAENNVFFRVKFFSQICKRRGKQGILFRLRIAFWVYSSACQNLAAISKVAIWGDLDKIILPQLWQDNCGNFFVMPKCGNFFVRKKVAISKSCHLGTRKFFCCRNFGNCFCQDRIARKMSP